jgi:hypothetical protein
MTNTRRSSTDCSQQPLLFQDLGPRRVVADFAGGTLSVDGGALLLREVNRRLGLARALAACFHDQRDQRFVEHHLEPLLLQRLEGLALGYEDLNDHAQLRRDPLLAVACDNPDPLGQERVGADQRGAALAAPATLNRLELSNNKSSRGHKLPHDPRKVAACLLTLGVRCLPKYTREIVVDLDAMGHLVHGTQEGRHFHAYYGDYCYLPLYAFVGDVPLWAQLRTSDRDAADGVVAALAQIISALRQRCRRARIIVRGDSGFCREDILAWCEAHGVSYCLGLAKNSVLIGKLQPALADARGRRCLSGAASARAFTEFEYRTRRSWSRARRVIGKAEVMAAGDNPRFLVTNLPAHGFPSDADRARFTPARLYEELYCARGEMENVLKQQTLDLQADRLSSHHLASNQLRLWLATLAYLLVERLRAWCLGGTELAAATVGTVRLRLLKVAAQVTVSVRRVHVRLSSAYPWAGLFRLCHRRLTALGAASG